MSFSRKFMPAVLGLALFTTACGGTGSEGGGEGQKAPDTAGLGSEADAEQMANLYAQAQENGGGQVIVYGPGEQVYGPAYEVFMQRYPDIQVVGQNIFGAELDTRLSQEFASGQHVGSVQTGGAPITLLTANQDRCESYKPFTAEYVDESLIGPNNTYRAVVGWPYGIEYNTNMLTEDEAPKSWHDFADPEWQGRFAMQDPTRISGTANILARMLHDGSFDESFVRALEENNPLIIADSAQVEQAVATGQRPVNFVGQYMQYLRSKEKGLPLGFVFPTEDGAALEYHYTCLLKDAPNPNASKLFVNWLFSPEGQEAMSTVGVYGVLEGAQPEGLPPMSELKPQLLEEIPRELQSEVTTRTLELTKEIFG